MSEAAPRRRWRDDPLSMFLAGAAVLLALLYFLEQRQTDSLVEATRRAQALAAGALAMDGCTVSSAGKGGQVLVVHCDQTARASAQTAATRSPDLTGFTQIVFVGLDQQLECPVGAEQWASGCDTRPLAAAAD